MLAAADPRNEGVLRYLGQGVVPGEVGVARPGPDTDTWRLGAHPDLVQRLWEDLNAALPADARFLVAGGAALVDPASGLVIGVALGTQYAIRLVSAGLAAARAAGFETRHTFTTVGRSLDLEATFGPGWVFGRHDDREGEWLRETVTAANL